MKKYIVIGLVLFAAAALYWSQLKPSQEQKQTESSNENEAVTETPPSHSGWASAAPDRALSKTSSRSVASVRNLDSSPAPTTEAGALALLQSQSESAWDLRRGDFTDQIRTLIHGQLKTGEGASPRSAADAFVKTYSQALFGVDPNHVQFDREEVTDRTRVTYQEVVNGVPVYGATLNLFFENGALSRVQNDMAVGEPASSSAPTNFTIKQAFEQYKAARENEADVTFAKEGQARTLLYPAGHSLVYAYEFSTNEVSKPGSAAGSSGDLKSDSFRVIYDAENPHIIKRASTRIQ
jgi:hypothetical protein